MHTMIGGDEGEQLDEMFQTGDDVVIARDALLEIHLPLRASRTWRFIAAGTRGRLIALHDGIGRVVLSDGPEVRKVALVGKTRMLRVMRH